MSTTWTIETLDRKTADGFVTTAHWRATAVDGDYSTSVYSTCSWSDDKVVIPYDQLTQDTVLGWVWESVDKASTEASLSAQIEALKNPTTATGVPWK
mgnify:FL=1